MIGRSWVQFPSNARWKWWQSHARSMIADAWFISSNDCLNNRLLGTKKRPGLATSDVLPFFSVWRQIHTTTFPKLRHDTEHVSKFVAKFVCISMLFLNEFQCLINNDHWPVIWRVHRRNRQGLSKIYFTVQTIHETSFAKKKFQPTLTKPKINTLNIKSNTLPKPNIEINPSLCFN